MRRKETRMWKGGEEESKKESRAAEIKKRRGVITEKKGKEGEKQDE